MALQFGDKRVWRLKIMVVGEMDQVDQRVLFSVHNWPEKWLVSAFVADGYHRIVRNLFRLSKDLSSFLGYFHDLNFRSNAL